MQLDGPFVSTEVGPRKQLQTKIDSGGVERVNGVFQFQPQIVVAIEPLRLGDQAVGEVGKDAPVAGVVGISQGAA